MSIPLSLLRSQLDEAIAICLTTADSELRSYYEGRRDVISELLVSMAL